MQLTIDVKESALDKIMYFLEHLKNDVTIVDKRSSGDLNIEMIVKDDPDYGYIKKARERRTRGEKTYSIDEVMKELE